MTWVNRNKGAAMGKRNNLGKIDAAKALKTTKKVLKDVGNEIVAHKDELLAIFAGTALFDSIKSRLEKKAIEKAYEKDSVKYQAVARKQEAEIRVLKTKAERGDLAEERVQQLEQVVHEILEGAPGDE